MVRLEVRLTCVPLDGATLSRRSDPQYLGAVCCHQGIGGDKHKRFGEGLGHNHPVERVAMQRGKAFDRGGMLT